MPAALVVRLCAYVVIVAMGCAIGGFVGGLQAGAAAMAAVAHLAIYFAQRMERP